MIENIALAAGLILLAALFIEVIIPRQTTALYEGITRRQIAPRRSPTMAKSLWFKAPAYALVAYLAYQTAQGDELSSVLLAALACVMAALSTYFRSFSGIVSDIGSARK
jgi:hypothetical protein